MNTKNLLLTFLTIVVMIGGTWLGVYFVSGNLVDPQTGSVVEKGVLSINSAPNGAAIYIDGRLQNATNTSIPFLTTGEYNIRLTKEGYIPWEKKVAVNNETVTKVEAILWPATPDPNPLTNTGVMNVTLSPDREKLVYAVKYSEDDKAGLWVMDMNRRAVFNNSTTAFTQIARNTALTDFSQAQLIWSPDNTQVLAILQDNDNTERNFLLDSSRFNTNPPDITLTKAGLLAQWKTEYIENNSLNEAKIAQLPEVKSLITNSSTLVSWSHDGSLFMYTTNDSFAAIPQSPTPLNSPTATPASTISPSPNTTATTQPTPTIAKPLQPIIQNSSYLQIMQLSKAALPENTKVFVYDIKNQESFELPYAKRFQWYPVEESTEREIQHLLMVDEREISMIESDGQNKSTVYAALFDPSQVFLWGDGGRLIISANFNPSAGSEPNLYTITLR